MPLLGWTLWWNATGGFQATDRLIQTGFLWKGHRFNLTARTDAACDRKPNRHQTHSRRGIRRTRRRRLNLWQLQWLVIFLTYSTLPSGFPCSGNLGLGMSSGKLMYTTESSQFAAVWNRFWYWSGSSWFGLFKHISKFQLVLEFVLKIFSGGITTDHPKVVISYSFHDG